MMVSQARQLSFGRTTCTTLNEESKRLDAAKRAIVNAMRTVTVGDPADPKIAVGPMVSQKQYDRVQSSIRKGIEEGVQRMR
jgi:aldehyde dehydrogenase (NAD+)